MNQPKKSQPLDILTFPLSGLRLIEASAGTGKTYTIAGLYLRLLLGHGAAGASFGVPLSVDRILVVTFTEAATAELRERILKAIRDARRALEAGSSSDLLIQSLLDDCPDKALALRQLLTAERQMDEAAIYTIHGFCQRMLTQNAFESGSLFDNEFLTEEQTLRATAVADFWRQITYQADAILAQALLKHWQGPEVLLRSIASHLALAGLQCQPRTQESLAERHRSIIDRLTAFRDAWRAAVGDIESVISTSGVSKQSYSKKNLPNWLNKVSDWVNEPLSSYQLPDAVEKFSAAVLAEKTKAGVVPSHPLFDQVEALLSQPNDIDDVVIADALTQVRERLQKQKQRQQQLSFDDLLANLARALTDDRGEVLAERIREQYPVAMIDEFQDTDPLQYQIFSTLYAQNPECGFYMIGDPKQAIYAFRGADIFTYITAKKQFEAHYTLQTNYRSTDELVTAVNALFEQANAPFMYESDIPFEAVKAKGKDAGFVLAGKPQTALQCCFPLVGHGGDVSGGDYQKQLALTAAAQIHQWLVAAQNSQATLDGKPLQPNDIAVLVRSGREAAAMQQALQTCGIASVYLSNRESVFAQAVAQDVARLLEACLNPHDEMLIRAAMATTLQGWRVSQLARLNDDEGLWETTVDQIRQAGELWRQRGILPMLRQWLFWHKIPERLLAESQGERLLTDVLHLGELLQTAASGLNGEHALLRWLLERCLQPNGDADEQQLRLDSERKRVQIVTIHKSKGLQYGLVLLPFICAYRGSDTPRYHTDKGVKLDLTGDKTAFEKAAQERLAEDLRLLYVALTRGIFVTWLGLANLKSNNKTKSKDDRPSALNYLLHDDTDASLTERCRRWLHKHNNHDQAVEVAELAFPTQLYQETVVPLAAAQARHFVGFLERNWRVTSYSALTVSHSSYTPPEKSLVVDAPEEAIAPRFDVFSFPKGAHAGTFLHSLLEDLNFGADATVRQQWIAQRLQGVQLSHDWQPDPWMPLLAEWLEQILTSELFPGLSLAQLSPQQCLSEMEFLLPLSSLSAPALNACLAAGDPLSAQASPLVFNDVQGMLKGFIDLVFEHQGRFYVVDYKSNYLGDNAAAYQHDAMAQAMIEHRYDVQYQLYTLALHRYLRCRIPDYDYDQHVGGVCYLFLRGMNGDAGSGVYATKPDRNHIAALDALFAGPVTTGEV